MKEGTNPLIAFVSNYTDRVSRFNPKSAKLSMTPTKSENIDMVKTKDYQKKCASNHMQE